MIYVLGGGTSLNFKVVGGTTQPANPSENTIWVNTSTDISDWAFSATQPASPTAGMVWLQTSIAAAAPFNALKKNTLMVYPSIVYQYISGAWVGKTAKTYQNGAWVDWRTYLFNNGTINTSLTGGIYYPAIENGAIHFEKDGISGGTTYTYSTRSKVDLTNYVALKARFISGNTGSSALFRVCVIDKTANGAHFTTSQLVATVSEYGPFNGIERIAVLDISGLSGEYYLGYAFGVRSTATAGNINNDVYEWWLE